MKQTAVEWFEVELESISVDFSGGIITFKEFIEQYEKLLKQAKEMEKQQMCQFAFDYQDEFFNNGKVSPIEQYYNETFKQ
jgi:hypothetical protein